MKKPNKYRAQKTTVDGITFDSKKEAKRYGSLKMLERAKVIKNIELQPSYPININGIKIAIYKADFRYWHNDLQHTTVEDVKGVRTPVYRLKKKLVEAIYGIEIVEV